MHLRQVSGESSIVENGEEIHLQTATEAVNIYNYIVDDKPPNRSRFCIYIFKETKWLSVDNCG